MSGMGHLTAVAALVALAAAGAPQLAAGAAIFRPTALFGDHMVLQATDPTDVSSAAQLVGEAASGETVTLEVAFGGTMERTYRTAADASGQWSIGGLKGTQNQGPFVLTLKSAGQTVTANDVWFGIVLMCTGQSNMELNFHPIYDNKSLIDGAHTPEIRLFQVPINTAAAPLAVGTPVGANWTLASPATVADFSAICYLTARQISSRTMCTAGACHFGLIESCLGSTDVQSWMSEKSREQARTSCWAEGGEQPPAALPPSRSMAPSKERGAATLLYNAMISPLARYTLGGVLWDQGENNVHYCTTHQYNCLFSTMLSSWRALWNQTARTLPVGFVQIGGYSASGNVSTVRLAQTDSLPAAAGWWSNHSHTRTPTENTAVAPTYDLCSPMPGKPSDPTGPGYHCWIHARNKSEVSRRLALQLLQLQAPAKGPAVEEYSGPIVVSVRPTTCVADTASCRTCFPRCVNEARLNPASGGMSPTVTLTMDHADGLILTPGQGCTMCCNQSATVIAVRNPADPESPLRHEWGIWLPAVGSMNEDGTVEVTPAGHARTVSNDWVGAVRYAMVDEPQCVLYNGAQLPALPFELPVPWARPVV